MFSLEKKGHFFILKFDLDGYISPFVGEMRLNCSLFDLGSFESALSFRKKEKRSVQFCEKRKMLPYNDLRISNRRLSAVKMKFLSNFSREHY